MFFLQYLLGSYLLERMKPLVWCQIQIFPTQTEFHLCILSSKDVPKSKSSKTGK